MSNIVAAPINPETEVTREDIAKMSGASLCKVGFVTIRDKWGFPKPIRPGPKAKLLYSRAEVIAWLEINDLKTMVFIAEDRAPVGAYKKDEKLAASSDFAKLPIGIRPKQFTGTGKSVTVHVPERHEYEKPHPLITRFSNSGADHRVPCMERGFE